MMWVWLTLHVSPFADLKHSNPQVPASVPCQKTYKRHKLVHVVHEVSRPRSVQQAIKRSKRSSARPWVYNTGGGRAWPGVCC